MFFREWKGSLSILTLFSAIGLLMLILAIIYSYLSRKAEFPVDAADINNFVLPLPAKPSVVVLPFQAVTEISSDKLIANSLTTNIYNELAQEKLFFVISNLSSNKLSGLSLRVKETAERLGVRYIISGSLERWDNGYRFFLTVIDSLSGERIIADSFDKSKSNIFEFRPLIMGKIYGAIGVDIERKGQALGTLLSNNDNSLWLKLSNYSSNRLSRDPKRVFESLRALEKMYEDGSRAYEILLEIAATYRVVFDLESEYFNAIRRKEIITQGLFYSSQAIAVKPEDSRAYSVKSDFLELSGKRNKSYEFKRKAASIGDNSFVANWDWAVALAKQQKYKKALPFMQQSLRLNPLHTAGLLQELAQLQYNARQPEAALETLSDVLAIRPASIPSNLMRIFILGSLGKMSEAKAAATNLLKLHPKFSLSAVVRGNIDYNVIYGPTWFQLMNQAGLPD